MKKSILFLILFGLIIAGCSPTVLFNSPQPAGKKDLVQFPPRYQGEYEAIDDTSFYLVEKYMIRQRNIIDISVPRTEIDTSQDVILEGNLLYVKETGEKVPVTFRNDSVFGTLTTYDTTFFISDKGILRKFKGYYFMNFKQEEDQWMVYKLKFTKDGSATLCGISKDEEIDQIKAIFTVEEIKNDKGEGQKYIIKPEKGDFKKLIEMGHFRECTQYKKIKND
jgi:hypothetical protein